MASALNQSLRKWLVDNVDVIAEPGRFFVSSAAKLACNVIARRTAEDPGSSHPRDMLYLDDGIFGNFANNVWEHPIPQPRVVYSKYEFFPQEIRLRRAEEMISTKSYIIWGATCDSYDCVSRGIGLPGTIETGYWLYYNDMGSVYARVFHLRTIMCLSLIGRLIFSIFELS